MPKRYYNLNWQYVEVGNFVTFAGQQAEVILNNFSGKMALDNASGQVSLDALTEEELTSIFVTKRNRP